jgi:hypothetical protein
MFVETWIVSELISSQCEQSNTWRFVQCWRSAMTPLSVRSGNEEQHKDVSLEHRPASDSRALSVKRWHSEMSNDSSFLRQCRCLASFLKVKTASVKLRHCDKTNSSKSVHFSRIWMIPESVTQGHLRTVKLKWRFIDMSRNERGLKEGLTVVTTHNEEHAVVCKVEKVTE